MYRSTAITQEPLPERSAVSPMFRLIVARMRKAVRIEIPIGYQDETGFHYGVKPAEKEVKWPPVW
jgi:hypothetical protein